MAKINELSQVEKKRALLKALGLPQEEEEVVVEVKEISKPVAINPSVSSNTPISDTPVTGKIIKPKPIIPVKPKKVELKKPTKFSDYKFQYYDGAFSAEPSGFLTLDRFLTAIKEPQGKNKELLLKIEAAAEKGDLELKSKLKSKLPAFTPCVNVSKNRRIESITAFTGLAVLDFDGIEHEEVIILKELLFEKYEFIIAVWGSPSGKGVKALVSIPVAKDVDEYREYVFGLGIHFCTIVSYDQTVVNPVLPLFIGKDEDILINHNYKTFRKIGAKKNDLSKREIGATKVITYEDIDESIRKFYPKGSIKTREELVEIVTKIYHSALNKIDDNGHPQFRGATIALGGYVISGYITYEEAIELMEESVEGNKYLNNKPSVYKKTGESSIDYGLDYPIILEH